MVGLVTEVYVFLPLIGCHLEHKTHRNSKQDSRQDSGHLHYRQQLRPPAAGRQRREHKLKALGAAAGEEVQGGHVACSVSCKE